MTPYKKPPTPYNKSSEDIAWRTVVFLVMAILGYAMYWLVSQPPLSYDEQSIRMLGFVILLLSFVCLIPFLINPDIITDWINVMDYQPYEKVGDTDYDYTTSPKKEAKVIPFTSEVTVKPKKEPRTIKTGALPKTKVT